MTHADEMVALYEETHGHRPVKSKDCCGCPSWPFAPCLRCGEENFQLYRKYREIHHGDEGDW